MLRLVSTQTELTTAATDAALAVVCLALLLALGRLPAPASKKHIWMAVFACLAVGSLLGSAAHGLALSASARATLWRPLYLSLGLAVGFFLVGAVGDWRSERAARTLMPWALGGAVAFFLLTQVAGAGFGLFLGYEAVCVTTALVLYLALWRSRRLPGAGRVAAGLAMTLVAAVIQASTLELRIGWPFDHNGLFHLAQIAAVFVIAGGVRRGLTETR